VTRPPWAARLLRFHSRATTATTTTASTAAQASSGTYDTDPVPAGFGVLVGVKVPAVVVAGPPVCVPVPVGVAPAVPGAVAGLPVTPVAGVGDGEASPALPEIAWLTIVTSCLIGAASVYIEAGRPR
jgi:hypothetical protein